MEQTELLQSTLDQASAWLATGGMELGINIAFALVIFYLGKWVAGALGRFAARLLRRAKVDETLVGFVSGIVHALLLAFVIIAALGQLGVQTASLVAIVGAAGLAVGLALQGSLANFAAGVLIILFRPFRAGDYIEAGGAAGTVVEIQIFSTRMRTPDNKVIIVPNAAITGGNIVNYSAESTRRLDLVVGVSYAADLQRTREILTEIVKGDSRVLDEPEPVIAVLELASSSVNLVVRPWVASADYWALRFDLTQRIKERLQSEGIGIPFPQMDVHLHRDAVA